MDLFPSSGFDVRFLAPFITGSQRVLLIPGSISVRHDLLYASSCFCLVVAFFLFFRSFLLWIPCWYLPCFVSFFVFLHLSHFLAFCSAEND